MEMLSSAVVAGITQAAPHVRIRFAPKRDSDPDLLRDGSVDLEIGKREISAPEIRTHFLFRDKYVGVARDGHPLLASGKVTPKRYAACGHVVASQIARVPRPSRRCLGRASTQSDGAGCCARIPRCHADRGQFRSHRAGTACKPGKHCYQGPSRHTNTPAVRDSGSHTRTSNFRVMASASGRRPRTALAKASGDLGVQRRVPGDVSRFGTDLRYLATSVG